MLVTFFFLTIQSKETKKVFCVKCEILLNNHICKLKSGIYVKSKKCISPICY